jgi:hypothetical protein
MHRVGLRACLHVVLSMMWFAGLTTATVPIGR